MSPSWFPKPYADLVARLRVPAGFLFGGCFIWLADPTSLTLLVGLPLGLAGLLLRAWAAGHIAKDRQLTTTGPYAYVRNPLYLGTALAGAGLIVAARSSLLALLFAALLVFVYLPAIQLEEQHLRELFPDYESYAAAVPRVWPRLRKTSRAGKFSFRLYCHNREYQAGLAYLAAVAVLVWKLSI